MLYRERQPSLPPLFEAVGCICVLNGKILLLHRQEQRSHPNCWGLPSGKIKDGEHACRAMIRELYEETGILQSSENLNELAVFHVISKDLSFIYALYRCDMPHDTQVTINLNEHAEYRWCEPADALRLKLVPDLEDCLRAALPELQPEQVQLDIFTKLAAFEPHDYRRLESSIPFSSPASNVRPMFQKRYWVSFGPPAAGKSTTLQTMRSENSALTLVRDSTIIQKTTSTLNHYLMKAWKENLRAYFFHFQMEVLPFRFWYTMQAPDYSLVDESIYSAFAYSRALHRLCWITDSEYQTFFANYVTYYRLLPKPQALMYFYCPPKVLLARIKRRGRKIELGYPAEYVEALAAAFEEVATELGGEINVLRINTEFASANALARTYVPGK